MVVGAQLLLHVCRDSYNIIAYGLMHILRKLKFNILPSSFAAHFHCSASSFFLITQHSQMQLCNNSYSTYYLAVKKFLFEQY